MSDDNISDGKHIAAAILAVEAARQSIATDPSVAPESPSDVSAYLFNHYREMLRLLDQTSR